MACWVGVGTQQPRVRFEPATSRPQVRHSDTRPPLDQCLSRSRCGLTGWLLWQPRLKHLKVSRESHLGKKLLPENLRKFYMTHLQVEQRKLQVKSGISWALLCYDSDRPITAHRSRKKTFRNRTHSISESWLSQSAQVCMPHLKSFLSKVTFEKTFRCVIGFGNAIQEKTAQRTSMPSRLMTELSNFIIAVLIASGFGKAVRPMLIAFERFVSSIVKILAPSCFCGEQKTTTALRNSSGSNAIHATVQ